VRYKLQATVRIVALHGLASLAKNGSTSLVSENLEFLSDHKYSGGKHLKMNTRSWAESRRLIALIQYRTSTHNVCVYSTQVHPSSLEVVSVMLRNLTNSAFTTFSVQASILITNRDATRFELQRIKYQRTVPAWPLPLLATCLKFKRLNLGCKLHLFSPMNLRMNFALD